jgi:hypothetical protein
MECRVVINNLFEDVWFEMTLNYRVMVERYPFWNGVVGGSSPAMKSSLYLTEKTSEVGRKSRAYPPQGRQYTPLTLMS